MTRRRSLAAAAGLLAVVVGVPCVLYGLGGGLPTSLPNGHQLHRFVTQPISDSDILRAISLVCWILWALFTAAVASEAVAYIRQHPSPSQAAGGFRVPGVQAAAGALFLAAVVLLPQRAANPAASALGRVPLAYPTQLIAAGSPPAAPPLQPSPSAEPSVAAGLTDRGWHPYTVVRYDTPWGIAEAHLGNGLRWREILDTDGHTLATGTDAWVERAGHWEDDPQARLIFPGQELLLPPDATGIPAAPVHSAPSTVATPRPEPTAPPVDPTSTTVPQPASEESPSVHISRPDPSPSARADPPSRTPASHEVARAKVSSQDTAEVIEVSSAILAAGIVAAAALNVLGRLRAGQSRRNTPGRRIRLPGPDLAETELALRIASRDDLLGLAHRAMHALAADLANTGLLAPGVCGMLVCAETVEVLLERPSPPPPSWQTSGEGFRWKTPASGIPAGIGDGPEPFPTLVPLGRVPATNTEVLLNVEAAGLVEVVGSEATATGIVHAAAVAFGGLPWAAAGEVILVGFGEALAATASHLRFVPSLDQVVDELNDLLTDRNPATSSYGSPLEDRQPAADREPPTVVLCARRLGPEHLESLRSVCLPGNGLAAVVVADTAYGPWAIDVDADPMLVPPLRVALEPISLPGSEFDAISELATVALDTAGAAADDPPYDQLDCSAQRHDPATPSSLRVLHTRPEEAAADLDLPAPPVTVKVLGPVDFEGTGEFRRPRSPEIALYLAIHPRGVTEAQLDERIWPARTRVPAATRDTAISAVRSALGGASRFPHAHQGPNKRYQLTDQVGTDWQRFCALHRHGRDHHDLLSLRAALELIRGRPFGDLDTGPGYEWIHLEGHLHHMEAEIADAADLAAQLYLGERQPLDARWAAGQGLLAAPYTERLWVQLMAAADVLGEAQEVERILADMDRRLGLDGDYGQLHPDTIAAYRLHSRRGRRAVT